MGAEATVKVTANGLTQPSKVRLEANTLHVRAANLKLDIPFKDMKNVAAREGVLSLSHGRDAISLELGQAAEKWAEKILHPPSRLATIGVKPHWRVSVIGEIDDVFVQELKKAASTVSQGSAVKDSDAIFLALSDTRDFRRIETLKRSLRPDGVFWMVRPKGHPNVTERAVMDAGKAAGLVDVKVVAFSSTHTAEKFVIPVKNRKI